jgi:amino acid permease
MLRPASVSSLSRRRRRSDVPSLRLGRFATIMNVLCSLFGAGILGVPHSFSFCGLVPSLVMLLVVGVLSHVGTVLTLKLGLRTKSLSLGDMTASTLGALGSIGISLCAMLYCISTMVAYLVIGSKTIIGWLGLAGVDASSVLWRRLLVVVGYGVFPVSLTLPRSIGFLAPFATVTFGCICFTVCALIAKAAIFFNGDDPVCDMTIGQLDFGIFSAVAIYALVFALPVVVLPVIRPYNPDMRKRTILSAVSLGICFLAVALTGTLGYIVKGNDSQDILLDDYPSGDILMMIVRIGFLVVVTSAYPCHGQSVMGSWSYLLFRESDQAQLPPIRRGVVLFLANVIPVLLAIFLPKAGPALSIGGAFGGCLVDFFFPALLWIVLSKKPKWHWQNLLCFCMCAFGLVTAVLATYQAILDAIAAF